MLDTLIVVASRDPELLRQSLPKMTKWPVAIVDTGAMIPQLWELADEYPNAAYLCSPYKGYDTGAYLWAFWTMPAKNYLFLQDSCCPREADFIEQFAERMPAEMGAVGWSSFDIRVWDSDAQRIATEWMYGEQAKWPSRGIFGPIFYTTHKTLTHLSVNGLLPMPPVHKQQQQAMERAWAILFHRAGVRVNFLVEEDLPRGYAMGRGEYPALNKTFRVRA